MLYENNHGDTEFDQLYDQLQMTEKLVLNTEIIRLNTDFINKSSYPEQRRHMRISITRSEKYLQGIGTWGWWCVDMRVCLESG